MASVNRIVFVEDHGNERAIMAKALFDDICRDTNIVSEARGIVVLFPEPMNQKVEAVLKSNGLDEPSFLSQELTEADFSEDTLILTMEEKQKKKVLDKYSNAINVQLLTDITGDELEIMDPYGGTLQSYGLCYESLSIIIKKLVMLVKNDNDK